MLPLEFKIYDLNFFLEREMDSAYFHKRSAPLRARRVGEIDRGKGRLRRWPRLGVKEQKYGSGACVGGAVVGYWSGKGGDENKEDGTGDCGVELE